jgi:molecular chaperone DnaJ
MGRYARDGDDLLCVAEISRELAEKGGYLDVDTLDGSKRLKLPRGTPDGRAFRIAGLGLPNLHTNKRGNLLVTVRIAD